MDKLDCKKCGLLKDVSNFSITKNRKRGYHTWCKDCLKEYDHNRHIKNAILIRKQKKDRRVFLQEWFKEKKATLKCFFCTEDFIECLEFHHTDPKEKEYNVSNMVKNGFSIKKIESEIAKCIVVCANCHRKIHAGKIII